MPTKKCDYEELLNHYLCFIVVLNESLGWDGQWSQPHLALTPQFSLLTLAN